MPAGRPSGYTDDIPEKARKLAVLGATDREVADFLNIDVATLYRWKHNFPEFCDALKVGKEQSDQRVEKSLYTRAIGYSFDSEKVAINAQGDVTRASIVEHVPPDTTAGIFWLKNRKPAEWRDRVVNEHTGADGGAIQIATTSRDRAKAIAALVMKAKRGHSS